MLPRLVMVCTQESQGIKTIELFAKFIKGECSRFEHLFAPKPERLWREETVSFVN